MRQSCVGLLLPFEQPLSWKGQQGQHGCCLLARSLRRSGLPPPHGHEDSDELHRPCFGCPRTLPQHRSQERQKGGYPAPSTGAECPPAGLTGPRTKIPMDTGRPALSPPQYFNTCVDVHYRQGGALWSARRSVNGWPPAWTKWLVVSRRCCWGRREWRTWPTPRKHRTPGCGANHLRRPPHRVSPMATRQALTRHRLD